ncbi:NUDIX domain-containing protein [Alloacidobacterium sp.]|uniref:NUDIX domain-containing protein n=1 Tax=Alloacidobacterium sp. TaxID=2951999 RepID=UPI002D25B8C4|nr:NUDIX domain-containing protein [Alloacidobacterium sp.]HYK36446.1 NUDIX domain-containing protein [Alloacidobacterium sp.]
MPKRSAGLLMYRRVNGRIEVLLAHPGGPFWGKKDLGAWSIPKGEFGPEEDALLAAKREFEEETGVMPEGDFISLGEQKQAGGKLVAAWAIEGDCELSILKSNLFSMEWPPRSGRMMKFPEVDRWAWFGLDEAREKILAGQRVFLERLVEKV